MTISFFDGLLLDIYALTVCFLTLQVIVIGTCTFAVAYFGMILAQFQKSGACAFFSRRPTQPKKRRGIYPGIAGLCKSFFSRGGFTKPYVTKNRKSGTCAVLLKLG